MISFPGHAGVAGNNSRKEQPIQRGGKDNLFLSDALGTPGLKAMPVFTPLFAKISMTRVQPAGKPGLARGAWLYSLPVGAKLRGIEPFGWAGMWLAVSQTIHTSTSPTSCRKTGRPKTPEKIKLCFAEWIRLWIGFMHRCI